MKEKVLLKQIIRLHLFQTYLLKEVADIEITKEYKKFNLGKVTKYISTSDNRVVPACPYYGVCGGCNIMHMSYCAQLDFKKDKVKKHIRKICRNSN